VKFSWGRGTWNRKEHLLVIETLSEGHNGRNAAQVGQELFDLWRTHLFGVALVVKQSVAFDPVCIALSRAARIVFEAGRGVVNNQFLKDFFQACAMEQVEYLALAVRNVYRKSNDFERVCRFFEALYTSRRLELPLKGILLIGY
jgi:hypothetical protein